MSMLCCRQTEMLFPHLKDGAVVLVSAQLPVGSVAALEQAFARQAGGRTVSFACSPENLRLGQAIEVFRNPGRIIVGVRDQRARAVLEPLLRKFCDNLIWMSVESAEMVKHGLNSFLALSVTFANELATVCEQVGADAAEVEKGLAVRSAHRPRRLYPARSRVRGRHARARRAIPSRSREASMACRFRSSTG